MAQKHTQGEWVVHPIGNAWLPPFVKVAKFHPGAGAYQIIADCSHEATNGIDCEANARLISAAPDLLNALQEALHALNGGPNTVGLHHQIETAIAKATCVS